MAGTLEHPKSDAAPGEAPQGAAAPAPPDAPAPAEALGRSCTACGAALADGQDWCLECGTAQPGRLGGRPGWRAALTVLGLTGVLAGGAAAASYAALSGDAERIAAAPPPPAAAPTVAAPPVLTAPPAPGPPADEQPPTVKAPRSDPADVPEAKGPAEAPEATPAPTPEPAPPASTPSPSPDPGGDGAAATGRGGDAGEDDREPVAMDLPRSAASTYDPYGVVAGASGEQRPRPGRALDGDAGTAWSIPVPPDGKVGAGLALSLEKAATLDRVEFDIDTPGFTVEVYATASRTLPPDILDARWEHVSDRRDVGTHETVPLDGRFRHVLLWISEQPADSKVAIPEVQLFD